MPLGLVKSTPPEPQRCSTMSVCAVLSVPARSEGGGGLAGFAARSEGGAGGDRRARRAAVDSAGLRTTGAGVAGVDTAVIMRGGDRPCDDGVGVDFMDMVCHLWSKARGASV